MVDSRRPGSGTVAPAHRGSVSNLAESPKNDFGRL